MKFWVKQKFSSAQHNGFNWLCLCVFVKQTYLCFASANYFKDSLCVCLKNLLKQKLDVNFLNCFTNLTKCYCPPLYMNMAYHWLVYIDLPMLCSYVYISLLFFLMVGLHWPTNALLGGLIWPKCSASRFLFTYQRSAGRFVL